MRLLSFTREGDAGIHLGLLDDSEHVIDLSEQAKQRGQSFPFDPMDMLSLIASGAAGLTAIRDLAQDARICLPLERLRLLAPIPRPRKNVFCVGWNYLEHYAEAQGLHQSDQQLPPYPHFFSKATTAVIGPYDPIPVDPAVSEKIDWEAELAVVIGTRGKNIPERDAFQHVFGYAVLNDISARDLQRRYGGQYLKGKSLDGSCPFGPWIVTKDEVDPDNLHIMSRVNGIAKQDSNTKYFYFKIPQIIAELSLGMTLEPGDIIATGTPQGVGFARTPPEFLKPGDLLETEIDGLGLLRNPVVAGHK
jgi:2-keto-4-pentenoate hydratase/2-oxohepta-3-ene-1,7-dioic acid hydratase in catechol pathway